MRGSGTGGGIYKGVFQHAEIVGLAIGTRPVCLQEMVLEKGPSLLNRGIRPKQTGEK